MMYKSTLTTLALLGAASAATSTTSLWLVGFDQQTILGSVIASDATATTYSLVCGNQEECGLPTPFIFTQGPSTLHYSYAEAAVTGVTETIQLGCVVTNSASGICSMSIDAEAIISSTSTTSFTDATDLGLMAVTITAGAAASNTAATTTGSSKSSATGSSSSGSATGSAATTGSSKSSTTGSSSSGSATGSAAGATSSASQNGALPMITQAPWVMGAVAAGMALAAI